MNPYFRIIAITILPYIELRGSIPYGIVSEGLNPLVVFAVATSANILIIWPAFIFLDWFFHLMEKIPFLEKTMEKTRVKARPYVEKYGMIGLAFFVGVPLPGTGAYSGALAAHILGIKNKKAFMAITAGVVLAGIAVTLMSTVLYEAIGWMIR